MGILKISFCSFNMNSFAFVSFIVFSIAVSVIGMASAYEVTDFDVAATFHSDLSKNQLTEMERASVTQMCLTKSFNQAQKYFNGNWQMEEVLYGGGKNKRSDANLRFHATHPSTGLGAE